MKTLLFRHFLLFLQISLVNIVLPSYAQTSNLQGKVISFESGKAVSGVHVSIIVEGVILSTYTDMTGIYYFSSIPTGKHILTFRHEKYITIKFVQAEIPPHTSYPANVELSLKRPAKEGVLNLLTVQYLIPRHRFIQDSSLLYVQRKFGIKGFSDCVQTVPQKIKPQNRK